MSSAAAPQAPARPTSAKRPQSASRSRPTSAADDRDDEAAPPRSSGQRPPLQQTQPGAPPPAAAEDAEDDGVYDDFEDSEDDGASPVPASKGAAQRGPPVPPIEPKKAGTMASPPTTSARETSTRVGKPPSSASARSHRSESAAAKLTPPASARSDGGSKATSGRAQPTGSARSTRSASARSDTAASRRGEAKTPSASARHPPAADDDAGSAVRVDRAPSSSRNQPESPPKSKKPKKSKASSAKKQAKPQPDTDSAEVAPWEQSQDDKDRSAPRPTTSTPPSASPRTGDGDDHGAAVDKSSTTPRKSGTEATHADAVEDPDGDRVASSSRHQDDDAHDGGDDDSEDEVFGAALWRSSKSRGAPPKAHRWAAADGGVGPNVYLLGGIVAGKPSASLFAFNRETSVFKALGSGSGSVKPPPVTGHTFTTCGTSMVLVGGGSPSVFTYASKAGAWKAVSSKSALADDAWSEDRRDPNDRKGHSAVAVGSCVYVFGGNTKRGKSNLVDIFNVSTSQWEPVSSPDADGRETGAAAAEAIAVSPVCHHTAVAFGGRMLVFGGKDAAGDSASTVHVYDVNARSWTAGMPCSTGPSPRHGHGAVAVDATTMAVFGGTTGSCDFSNELWLLNVSDFVWSKVDVVGAPPRAFGALALAGRSTQASDPNDSDADDDDGDGETPPTAEAASDQGDADGNATAAMPAFSLVWLGGGALPPAGASRYAQLAFTASADVVVMAKTKRRRTIGYVKLALSESVDEDAGGTSPSPRGGAAASQSSSPTKPAAGGSRGASKPRTRPASAPARAAAEPGNGGGGGDGPSGKHSGSRRRSSFWKLGGDFPPAPPVHKKKKQKGNGGDADAEPQATGISDKTLARLCPSKEERDRRLEAVRAKHDAQMQQKRSKEGGPPPPSKLTAEQTEAVANRMCKGEQKNREVHRQALLKKVLGDFAPAASRRLNAEEMQVMADRLCDGDVKRFRNAHAKAAEKYGFVPQPRTRSPSSRDELNDRFYGPALKREARREKLLNKYIKGPKTMALDEDELRAVVERLNSGSSGPPAA